MVKPNPEGQLIGSSSKPWRIGKMLGEGACGSVHEIARVSPSSSHSNSKKSSDFVIKVAPYIKPSGTKGKKRKKTAIERNADLLLHENTLYKNVFNKLRGRLIPDVPICGSPSLIPPGFGEINNIRFFVMERMEAPFFDIVSIFRQTNKDGQLISLGEVFIAMITCIKEIHEHRHIFIDVKPENFMLSKSNSKSHANQSKELAKRIRILDLGLVESFHDMSICSHRENNFPNSQFVGTPLYASLNVLEGHTPSRRDDLEALLYIAAELMLMIIENRNGEVLPWSNCKSDEEILKIKRGAIENGDSLFFQRLCRNGNDVGGKVMKDAFDLVRCLRYSEKPKYNELEKMLQAVCIYSGGSQKKENKAKKRCKSSTTENIDHNVLRVLNNNETKVVEKKQKSISSKADLAPRRSRRLAVIDVSEDSPHDVITINDGNENAKNENSKYTTNQNEENKQKNTNCKTEKNESSMQLIFISGPHKGECISLTETLILGRDPELAMKTSKRKKQQNSVLYALPKEKEASASHVSLALCTRKRGSMSSVRLTDLNSTNGTCVNGKEMKKGGYCQMFSGDKIKIGETTAQLRKFSSK